MKEFTRCSQCNNLIWRLNGKWCRSVSHWNCLLGVITKCSKHVNNIPKTITTSSSSATRNHHQAHKLKQKLFSKPTFCNHCGTLVARFLLELSFKLDELSLEHGLEYDLGENGCGITIRLACLDKINLLGAGEEWRCWQQQVVQTITCCPPMRNSCSYSTMMRINNKVVNKSIVPYH